MHTLTSTMCTTTSTWLLLINSEMPHMCAVYFILVHFFTDKGWGPLGLFIWPLFLGSSEALAAASYYCAKEKPRYTKIKITKSS